MTDYVNEMFDGGVKKNNPQEYMQNKTKFDSKNYLNVRLGENETSRRMQIRVILTQDIDGKYKVAVPIEVHNLKLNAKQRKAQVISTNDFKSFVCLDDPHVGNNSEKCPLCAKMEELKKYASEYQTTDRSEKKALWKEAFAFESKTAYIVRCIERGHESEGVKFWRFYKHDDGSGIFDTLKNMAEIKNNDSLASTGKPYNMFDYQNGRDLYITLSKDPNPKPNAPDKTVVSVIASDYPTPLSTNQEEAMMWINDNKSWRDMYSVKNASYLSIVADGESPVWDKENRCWSVWKDVEELKKEDENIVAAAQAELAAPGYPEYPYSQVYQQPQQQPQQQYPQQYPQQQTDGYYIMQSPIQNNINQENNIPF